MDEVKKWKWKKVKSEWVFGPLNFFNLRYIKGGVRGNNNIGIKKCTTIFLWVLNFGQVGEIFKNFQNHTTTVTFFKNGLQLVIFEKFTKDCLYKIEGDFFYGISFENWRRFQKKIKGISFVKFYPRASLARAAFTLKLSLIPAIVTKTYNNLDWRFV